MTAAIIALLRPQQWVKNLFVMLPAFLSGGFSNDECFLDSLIAFAAFSFMASGVYCLNDWRDAEADREHPTKRDRPVATGEISSTTAIITMAVMIVLGLSACLFLPWETGWKTMSVLIIYLCINIAYCYRLREMAGIDLAVIVAGFLLRVIAGGAACDVWVSPWTLVLTGCVTLMLGLGKRREELVIMSEPGYAGRKSLRKYTLKGLNIALMVLGVITVMVYFIYTLTPEVRERTSRWLWTSSYWVFLGVWRYLYLVLTGRYGGEVGKILLNDYYDCPVLFKNNVFKGSLPIIAALWVFWVIITIYVCK